MIMKIMMIIKMMMIMKMIMMDVDAGDDV